MKIQREVKQKCAHFWSFVSVKLGKQKMTKMAFMLAVAWSYAKIHIHTHPKRFGAG